MSQVSPSHLNIRNRSRFVLRVSHETTYPIFVSSADWPKFENYEQHRERFQNPGCQSHYSVWKIRQLMKFFENLDF